MRSLPVNPRLLKIIVPKYFNFLRVVALLGTISVVLFSNYFLPTAQNDWFTLSALLTLCFSEKLITERNYLAFLLAAIICSLSVLISSLLYQHLFFLLLWVFTVNFGLIYIGLFYNSLWGILFVSSLLLILSTSLPVTFPEAFDRCFWILAGMFLVIIIQLPFQNSLNNIVRRYLSACLLDLIKLSKIIFACYLTSNYTEEYFAIEKQLHHSRSEVLFQITQVRKLLFKISISQREYFLKILNGIEQSYEVLQSLGLLIYRVEDHSTFDVAQKEILAIAVNIEKQFQAIAKKIINIKYSFDNTILNDSIYELAEINQRIFTVVAKEPVVFLIFVQDLYCLDKLINEMAEQLN